MKESRIRHLVRQALGDRVVFIENSQGGTPGLPDCLVFPGPDDPILPEVIGLELKGPDTEIRPQQRVISHKFWRLGSAYFILRSKCLDERIWEITVLGLDVSKDKTYSYRIDKFGKFFISSSAREIFIEHSPERKQAS